MFTKVFIEECCGFVGDRPHLVERRHRRFGVVDQQSNTVKTLPRVHRRGRRPGERPDGLRWIDTPTVAFVEVSGDRPEVMTV